MPATAGPDPLEDLVSGPGEIAVEVEVLSEVSLCGGWSVFADVYVADAEAGWVSDLTAELLPVQCLSELGFGDLSPEELDSRRDEIKAAYQQQFPGAVHVFTVNTGCAGTVCDLDTNVSFTGIGERVSRSRCGDSTRLGINISPPFGEELGSFTFGVRFRGNRFRRHICVNTINSIEHQVTHAWLTLYAESGASWHVGFYPRRFGLFYLFGGVVKNEPAVHIENYDARYCIPVTRDTFELVVGLVSAIEQSPPVYNLSGVGNQFSSNCMDFVRGVMDQAQLWIPPTNSAILPQTAAPLAFQGRLENYGNGSFVNCGQVVLGQNREQPGAGTGGTGLYDMGPEWLATATAIPPGGPAIWPAGMPLLPLPGGNPVLPISVAHGSTVRLVVNADTPGAAVAATNNDGFTQIVRPGEPIEFQIQNPFAELLSGGLVTPGGVQTFRYLFLVVPGANEGAVELTLDAPPLDPVTPIVEPGMPPIDGGTGCIYDCDGDGSPDCDLADCDNDGVPDACEVLLDPASDADGDGIPDNCAACLPDLAEPFGLLDLSDVIAFVTGFSASDPAVDFDKNGLFDLADVVAFVTAFAAGCP